VTEWPLVSRQVELERVRTMLTVGGHAGVVLAGPSGVGKTRLAVEYLAVATALGYATSRITATHSARALPFGAFGPLLPASGQGTPPADGIFGVLNDAHRVIADRAKGRGLVLLIDDAHLLDDSSATLAHQLATTRSVFLVATVRSGEAVPDPLVALWKDGIAERIDLRPLCPNDIPNLLEAVLGGPVDGVTKRHLISRCGGNIQFLRELVMGALDAGALRDEGGVWRMAAPAPPSDRLAELVESRLRGLSDAERSVLETVAYGEPVGVAVLRSMISGGHLEALERRGLLDVTRDGQRLEARLAHPVHGDVLRAHMPLLRAEEVRRSLADQVQAFGVRRREDLLRVAQWRLVGGGTLPTDLALRAADRAYYLCDFDLAERLAQVAVESGGGFDSSVFAGWVGGLTGKGEAAERKLAALAPRATTDAEHTMVAVARVDNLLMELGRTAEALQVLEDTKAAVSDPPCIDELEAKRAYVLVRTERPAEAVLAAERLIDRAQGRALVEACLVGGLAYPLMGRLACGMQATEIGERIELDAIVSPRFWHNFVHIRTRCEIFLWAGNLREAEDAARSQYERAVVDGRSKGQASFAWALNRVAVAQGRVATAVRWGREAVTLRRNEPRPSYLRWALVDLAHALALTGDVRGARAVLRELDGVAFPTDAPWWAHTDQARAWLEVAEGDVVGARRRLHEVATRARGNGELAVEARALHDIVRLGGASEVVDRLQLLAAEVEGDLVALWARHADAAARADPTGLEEVSQGFEAIGAMLLAAEAAADASAALRRAGAARRALAVDRRAADLAARCEGAKTPALAPVVVRSTLTAREREVASLAASGLSNREITERLVLSVRTVENQLQRVYEKLGIRSRAELADALHAPDRPGLPA
jgi:DNA-binding CsgD family transcriptional regulator